MSPLTGRAAHRALAVLAVLVAAATLPSAAAAADARCNPLSVKTCLAPFPSNYWTITDATSPTGLRGDVSDDLLRAQLLRQLPAEDGITPTDIFGGATGFSSGAGALFEFTRRQAPPPSDGGDIVVAFDLDAGVRVPVDAFLSAHARNPVIVGARQSNVLQVFPRARWPFGHRVLVAVSTGMGEGDPAFSQLAARATPGTRAAAYVADVERALKQAGVDPAATRTATVFTVRDRASVVDPTERLMRDTAGRPHPVREVRVSPERPPSGAAAVVLGEVRVDNYRTRDGRGPVDFSGTTRKDQWLPFRLTLPPSASSRPAPVVIYAHGITSDKESDGGAATINAGLGLATISIDWPNHGERARADGGFILSLLRPRRMGTLAGLFNQATIDLAGLYDAIGDLDLDLLGPPTAANPRGRGADGRPDLNTRSISMEGTSLGGVLGGNFAALAPKLDFVSFQVHGHGLGRIIAETALWNGFGFALPSGRTGTEDAILQVAIQQVLDPADGINTLDFMRHPRPGQTKKPLQMLVGKSDAIVPNGASIVAANLLDIPLVGTERFAMPGVRRATDADPDGYELRQYPPLVGPLPIPLVSEASAHGAFQWPASQRAQSAFIRRFGPKP